MSASRREHRRKDSWVKELTRMIGVLDKLEMSFCVVLEGRPIIAFLLDWDDQVRGQALFR
jgi:hypothetical protein